MQMIKEMAVVDINVAVFHSGRALRGIFLLDKKSQIHIG